MEKRISTTTYLVRAAAIAAIYATITLVLAPISYGNVQFRVSEALTVLPLLFPEAIPGLAIGCFIANIASGPLDMILGTAATLVAAILTRYSRKIYLGIIPPIVINALIVPIILLTIPEITEPYWLNVIFIGLGQLGAVCALGVPLYFTLKKSKNKLYR